MKIRASEGGAFESRGRFFARLTIAPQKRKAKVLPWCTSLDAAEKRANALQAMINDLRAAGQPSFIDAIVKKAPAYDEPALAELQRSVAGIVKGRIEADTKPGKGAPETFKSFGEKWTSGELHAMWPDAVRPRKDTATDESRLSKLYETIGPIPLARFTLADAHEAMRKLPAGIEPNTRRAYALLIQRVCALAAYPAGSVVRNLLERSKTMKTVSPTPATVQS